MELTDLSGPVARPMLAACLDCPAGACDFRTQFPKSKTVHRFGLARGERLECGQNSCMRFWVVVSGTAATCVAFRDGRRQIAALEPPGSLVCGPMADHGTEHWLEALDDVEICEIDVASGSESVRRNEAFMSSMFRMIHGRLERALMLVSMLGRLDSQERVTLFLAEMSIQSGGANAVVSLPMSREDIADYLGLNTETVSRVFTRIRKSGLVRFLSPTEYLIPDMQAVAARLPVRIPGYEEGQSE